MSRPQPGHPRGGHERPSRLRVADRRVLVDADPGQPDGRELMVDEAVVRIGLVLGRREDRGDGRPPVRCRHRDLVLHEPGPVADAAVVARPGGEPLGFPGDPARLVQLQAVDQGRCESVAGVDRLERQDGPPGLVPDLPVHAGGVLRRRPILEGHPDHRPRVQDLAQAEGARRLQRFVGERHDRLDVLGLDRPLPGRDQRVDVGRAQARRQGLRRVRCRRSPAGHAPRRASQPAAPPRFVAPATAGSWPRARRRRSTARAPRRQSPCRCRASDVPRRRARGRRRRTRHRGRRGPPWLDRSSHPPPSTTDRAPAPGRRARRRAQPPPRRRGRGPPGRRRRGRARPPDRRRRSRSACAAAPGESGARGRHRTSRRRHDARAPPAGMSPRHRPDARAMRRSGPRARGASPRGSGSRRHRGSGRGPAAWSHRHRPPVRAPRDLRSRGRTVPRASRPGPRARARRPAGRGSRASRAAGWHRRRAPASSPPRPRRRPARRPLPPPAGRARTASRRHAPRATPPRPRRSRPGCSRVGRRRPGRVAGLARSRRASRRR